MKITLNGIEFEVDNEKIQEQLKEGVENPLIEIKSDDHILRSTADDTTLIDNHKKDARKEGVEIAIKNARNDFSLDFQGKTMENLMEAIKVKTIADSSVEPNKQIEEKDKDIKRLELKITEIEGNLESEKSVFGAFKKTQHIQSTLLNHIPDNISIPRSDMLTIIQNRYKIDVTEDNNLTFANNGGVMKNDNNANPLTTEEVLNTFFDENKAFIKAVDGGAGGDDSTSGGKARTIEVFNKEQQDKGIAQNSPEYVKAMELEIKAGTLTV